MNSWHVTIMGIIAYNGFGFKESENTHWTCGCSSHYFFPFFPGLHYDEKEPSHLCQDEFYSCLQGVICAHLKGSYMF